MMVAQRDLWGQLKKVLQRFVSGQFALLGVLLILVAGCGSAVISTIPLATSQLTPQSTLAPLFDIQHAPTPPVIAPLVFKTLVSSNKQLETPTAPQPTISEKFTLLPTATPTAMEEIATEEIENEEIATEEIENEEIATEEIENEEIENEEIATETLSAQPVALGEIALPVPEATEATVDPVATISVQLEQPIANSNVEAENTNQQDLQTIPQPPPIPENQSPLPVVNVTTAPLQIPENMGWDGVQRSTKVPILMYHYISVPPPNADIYRKDLSVSPELFNAQLDRIQAEGYTTISLYDLLNHLLTGVPLPEKALVITFDDGYRDNYENAFPSLKAHGMTATFFVVMEFINAQRPEYMTWDMLREMQNAGISVEAHGVDHSSLKNRDRDFLDFQALRSYETLQNELGHRARFISYPAGQYDQNTIEVFKSAGYWAGITTIQGATHSTDNLFELRRVRVRGTTSPDDLAKLLATDW